MTTHLFTRSAAVLTLALLAATPALACSSSAATQVEGYSHLVRGKARGCAQLGIAVDGYGHIVDSYVEGEDSRVVHGSRGGYTNTHSHVVGESNRVGSLASSGGRISTNVDGDDNQVAQRAKHGARSRSQVSGSGNKVFSEAN